MVELMRSAQSEIMEILTNVFEHFRNDSQSVRPVSKPDLGFGIGVSLQLCMMWHYACLGS